MNRYSYSQIRTFSMCQHKWYLERIEGIRALRPNKAPTLGSAIHEGIASLIRGADPNIAVQQYMNEQQDKLEPYFNETLGLEEEWEDISHEVNEHAIPIVLRWADWVKLKNWETVVHPSYGVLVERQITLPVISEEWGIEFEFTFIVDWVAHHRPTGLIWLIDHKTTSQFSDPSIHEFNLQKMVYQHLLGEIDIPVDGSRIGRIKTKVPSIPKINQNGTVSRADIATTWEIYRQAVIDANEDPDDYLSMRAKLPGHDYWFSWASTPRTRQECKAAWDSVVIPQIARMEEIRNDPSPAIHPRALSGQVCPMCNLSLPCMETLRGRPLDAVLDFGFTQRG